MKNRLKFLFVFVAISVFSCDELSKKPPTISVNEKNKQTSLKLAERQIHNYYAYNNSKTDLMTTEISQSVAFTIDHLDVLKALGVADEDTSLVMSKTQFRYIRAYLGLKDSATHLYFTPVVGANLEKNIAGKDTILSDSEGYYVMDFVMPCPNACDDTSELYESAVGSEEY